MSSGLIALVGDAPHAWTMVNALRKRFGDFCVIVEKGEPASAFWARRRKKLGAAAVASMKAAQLAAKSQELVVETMAKVLAGEAKPLPKRTLPSNQYYAPTLGQYLSNGLKRGVW